MLLQILSASYDNKLPNKSHALKPNVLEVHCTIHMDSTQ